MSRADGRFWKGVSKKSILLICLALPILVALPGFFSIKIEKQANGLFVKKLTSFGSSQVFACYLIAAFLFESVIPILIISGLNVASIYKFKAQMESHHALTRTEEDTKQVESRHTRIVLILMTVCIVSRLFDLAASLPFRLGTLSPSLFSNVQIEFLKLMMSLTNLFLFVSLVIDGLVYLKMDKNLWRLSLALVRIQKVIIPLNPLNFQDFELIISIFCDFESWFSLKARPLVILRLSKIWN